MNKIKIIKQRIRAELVLKLPDFQIYRVKNGLNGIEERITKIYMEDLIDESSLMNLKNAVGYLEMSLEDEVFLIAKVKTKRISCNYLKLIIEKKSTSQYHTNQLKVICEWVS